MDLWRHTLALAQEGDGRIQRELLTRAAATVTGWSDLLRLCRAAPGGDAALGALKAEVTHFKTWIDQAVLACELASEVHAMERSLPTSRSVEASRTRRRRS